MTYICSTGVSIPKHTIQQEDVKQLVKKIFGYTTRQIDRFLPVFDNADIEKRQFVVEKEWFEKEHTFAEKNNLYVELAKEHSLEAVDNCLSNDIFLKKAIPYEAIDMILFVTSSGILAPTMDVHILNERPFRQDVVRMPLWGLGCAGGAMGLSRAHDWIRANPDKTALLVCSELCSLTFQKGDVKKSNIVGTALFGDGLSATLLVGEKSPYLVDRKKSVPKIKSTSTRTKPNSSSVMGWDVTNNGLEVIFSKSIPALVDSFWREHIELFLQERGFNEGDFTSFIAHPGGKKVLLAMEDVLDCPKEKLKHSYHVLRNHGNMSSATVLYVLSEWMKETMHDGDMSMLSALGPGFTSELLLLEWVE